MRSIFNLAPKPSDAVRAMIEGLEQHSKREDFFVDMGHYLMVDSEQRECFGCAATCALQQITDRGLQANDFDYRRTSSRSEVFNIDGYEINCFEEAVDQFRRGDVSSLFKFYGIPLIRWVNFKLPVLETDNWQIRLPQYKKFLKILISKGL